MDRSTQLLTYLTGVEDHRSDDEKDAHAHHHHKMHVITDVERAEVGHSLRFDIELYDYAKEKFEMLWIGMQRNLHAGHNEGHTWGV